MLHPCPKPLPAEPKRKGGRRTERAWVKDLALDAWKLAVKATAGGCEMAGLHHRCAGPLHAHHVLTRGARPLLTLDLENGVALCGRAHDLVHRARWFRPHFWAWFFERYPGRREALLAKAAKEGRLA